MENKSDISSQYPSVDLAYETVKPSYDVMLSRFEAANARIQNLMTWAIGVTGIMPILAKSLLGDIDFNSLWLLPMLLAFVALIIIGISAYRTGRIKLLHPQHLYEDFMQFPEWEYKKWLVYWAGKHFDTNQRYLNIKSRYIDIMTALLGLEVISFLALWVIVG